MASSTAGRRNREIKLPKAAVPQVNQKKDKLKGKELSVEEPRVPPPPSPSPRRTGIKSAEPTSEGPNPTKTKDPSSDKGMASTAKGRRTRRRKSRKANDHQAVAKKANSDTIDQEAQEGPIHTKEEEYSSSDEYLVDRPIPKGWLHLDVLRPSRPTFPHLCPFNAVAKKANSDTIDQEAEAVAKKANSDTIDQEAQDCPSRFFRNPLPADVSSDSGSELEEPSDPNVYYYL
ncbi:uncharacterized protein LOC126802752 isoform X5 [Argentina anserina]|uniref:uncharacterized protein LOC126802752 isoform X5 n=1 Tax=Argentina anserina TaxID=57926 RepID=UPI0021768C4A|nr:uncharacterized protein LOC126802752 isoform X5 [Potentilla anserina]